jgi:pyridoxamine 5'-phosphate oxidase
MAMHIADIRKEYRLETLDESQVSSDPIEQFGFWWKEALKSEIDEVNAMTLATATADAVPAARIVLLKGFDRKGFVFFTNYESNKAADLEMNPRASLVFFWKELERQVRISGTVEKVSEEESDHYFSSRPKGSRIGAWASPQSSVISSRDIIEEKVAALAQSFEGKEIPRPLHWGGYRVIPLQIEFWQGRSSRLHDRIQYTSQPDGSWKIVRLAP